MSDSVTQLSRLIWSVADLLRGDFKRSDYGRVVLPFTVLRRLDCLLAPTRRNVLEAAEKFVRQGTNGSDALLRHASGHPFYNTSPFTLADVVSDPQMTERLLLDYVRGFSQNIQEVFERFEFGITVKRLADSNLLYHAVARFQHLDLGPTLSVHEMSLIFEELVRSFAEQASEMSGEHTTPRDVSQLMTALVMEPDLGQLAVPGVVWTVLDPVCGTGGLLGEVADRITDANPEAQVRLFGQELNPESWAIACSSMLMSGHDPERMALGNVLREDLFATERFDYLLAHPPFGIEWKKVEEHVRTEHEYRGHQGRFGAGLPRINDGSLLFLQHMLAKMKPVDESGRGGSRIAITFNGSPMFAGPAGSGEADIRRWIVENDWLEGIVALPDQLLSNTGISTYVWVLSNRKLADRQGRVILVKAQDHWQKMRQSVGGKRKYLGPDQLTEIVQLYSEATSSSPSSTRSQRDHVRVVRNQDLLYRQIVIERPLRLRFELSEEAIDRLAALRPVQRTDDPEALLAALRGLVGTTWNTSSDAHTALRRAAEAAGLAWPGGTAFEKAVRNAIGVRDDNGELQRRRGAPEPDVELRNTVSLPFHEEPEDYLRAKVRPRAPDAWIDPDRTRLGCEIPSTLFYVADFDGPFEPLQNFARLETDRVKLHRPAQDEDAPAPPKHLTAPHLHSVDSAVELPDAELDDAELAPCSGGDLVGRFGNWRLLPAGFGEAVTPLFVLHPLRGRGRVLCEWLNSRKDNGTFPRIRDLLDTPVPVDLVTDTAVDDLLEEVQEGRRALRAATEGILPNIFSGSETLSEEIRTAIRFASHEARLAGQLVRPFDDPIWRAESSYPFHMAALARRYRVSTHPAERKDGLLKLGEGTARTLGILALSELIAHHNGFTRSLRQQFRNGATFGTWLWLIDRFLEEVGRTPALPELAAIRERDTTRTLLEEIKDFRNHSHHAHGVRMSHEIDEDVEKLEPRVVSTISSVNWLSGIQWYWVERCEYLDDSSYRTVGLRLRGSHPSWEPFERSTTYPLRPDRIYVDSDLSGRPVDLWPLALASLCPDCRTRELFLLNQVRDGQVILRSLEEHSLEIPYRNSEGI
ncbi:type I restriction-modification system subunit M [[Kitasatospora] papulosa]|uniref:type I restriction-modification system subunit M n=1 Tax=[Kitasatospora] papulosa TaxID=1464011 RepID=UPI002E0FF898|nr:type I restriction-modification system subunit M [[Kitasatospora] papulosa]